MPTAGGMNEPGTGMLPPGPGEVPRLGAMQVLVRAAITMVAAGLLLLPGYYLYCKHWSGSSIGAFELSTISGQWPLSDGSILRLPNGPAFAPVRLSLDPSLSPLGLVWRGHMSGAPMNRDERNDYRARLFFEGRPVADEAFSVSRDQEDGGITWKWVAVGPFTVQQAGRYDLVLQQDGRPGFAVGGMQVEVRRNVTVPRTDVLLAGAALLVVGVGVLLLGVVRGRQGAHSR